MDKIIIVKNGIRTSLMNDVVYGRFDISLFARGCIFGCEYCHSQECSSILGQSEVISAEDIVERFGLDIVSSSTIVGVGGDFSMQIQSWIEFCERLKTLCPSCKIVLFTGMEFSGAKIKNMGCVDAIVWGRKLVNGRIRKTITKASSDHSVALKRYDIEVENVQNHY